MNHSTRRRQHRPTHRPSRHGERRGTMRMNNTVSRRQMSMERQHTNSPLTPNLLRNRTHRPNARHSNPRTIRNTIYVNPNRRYTRPIRYNIKQLSQIQGHTNPNPRVEVSDLSPRTNTISVGGSRHPLRRHLARHLVIRRSLYLTNRQTRIHRRPTPRPTHLPPTVVNHIITGTRGRQRHGPRRNRKNHISSERQIPNPLCPRSRCYRHRRPTGQRNSIQRRQTTRHRSRVRRAKLNTSSRTKAP